MEEARTIWFNDHNNDQDKRALVFYVHKIIELFSCGLAGAAEGFNTASRLLLGSVNHVDKMIYKKATMNTEEDIKEVTK